MPFNEQHYLNSQKYLSLAQGEALYARTLTEGQFPRGPLTRVAITGLAQQVAADHRFVSWYQKYLMQRDGIPVSQVLRELERPALPVDQAAEGFAPPQQPPQQQRREEQAPPADDMDRRRGFLA